MSKKLTKLISLLLSVIMLMGAMPLNMLNVFAATIDDPLTIADFRMYEEITYGQGEPINEKTGVLTVSQDWEESGIFAQAYLSGEGAGNAKTRYVWFYSNTDSITKFDLFQMVPFGISPWDWKGGDSAEALAQMAIEYKLGDGNNYMPLMTLDEITNYNAEKYLGDTGLLAVGCLAYAVQDDTVLAAVFTDILVQIDFSAGATGPKIELSQGGYAYYGDLVLPYETVSITATITNLADFPGATYQWYRADNEYGNDLQPIDGATDATYDCPLPPVGSSYYYTCAAIFEGKAYFGDMFYMIDRASNRRYEHVEDIVQEADYVRVGGADFTDTAYSLYGYAKNKYFLTKMYEVTSKDSYENAVLVDTYLYHSGYSTPSSVTAPSASVAFGETKYYFYEITYLGSTEEAGDEESEETCRTNIFMATRAGVSKNISFSLSRKWVSYCKDNIVPGDGVISQHIGAQLTFAYLSGSGTPLFSDSLTLRIYMSANEDRTNGTMLFEETYANLSGVNLFDYFKEKAIKVRVPSDVESTMYLWVEWENTCNGETVTGSSDKTQKVITAGTYEDYFVFDKSTGVINGYFGSEEVLVIPATIGGVAVKTVGGFSYISSSFKYPHGENYYSYSSFREVIISEGIEGIAKRAFYGQKSLEKVTFPSTIKTIGESAFEGCQLLTTLDFSAITYKQPFTTRTYKNELLAPEKDIGMGFEIYNYAFGYCTGLERMILPADKRANMIVYNEKTAFLGAMRMVDIQNIGRIILVAYANESARCSQVYTNPVHMYGQLFLVDSEGAHYDAYVIDDEKRILYYYDEQLDAYSIARILQFSPEIVDMDALEQGILRICNLPTTFNGKKVIGVGSPYIRSFAYGAFYASPYSEDYLKYYYGELYEKSANITRREVVLPESYTHIYRWAFYGGANGTQFGSYASVTLPTTPVFIGDHAFTHYDGEMMIQNPEALRTVMYIGEAAFSGDFGNSLNTLVFDYDIELGANAFAYNELAMDGTGVISAKVVSITFNGNVKMGRHAFQHESKLTSVIIKGNADIGQNAFLECSALKTFMIGEGKTLTLGQDAFERCFELETTNVNYDDIIGGEIYDDTRGYSHFRFTKAFPDVSDTSNGNSALRYIRSGIYCIVGKKSATTNYKHFYYLGYNDADVTFPGGLVGGVYVNEIDNNVMQFMGEQTYKLTIGEGITTIKGYGTNVSGVLPVFPRCHSVKFPDTMTVIPGRLFYTGLKEHTALTRVEFPSTLVEIGANAFEYCPLEGTLEIPASCKKIGSNAFGRIETITTLILHEGLEEIGAEAFRNSSIKRIITIGKNDSDETVQTFPDSLKSIGRWAFLRSPMEGTLLLDGTKLSTVTEGAFAKNDSLTKFIVRNAALTVLEEEAISGKMMEEVDLSESAITRIEGNNFSTGNALKTIRFPAGLTYIGYNALNGFDCSDMVLPAGLLQYRAGTKGHLTLPESVIGINPDIFREHTIITFLNKDKEIRSYNGDREWDSALPTSISKNCLIRCYKGSFIHQWCLDNNITYELIDGDTNLLRVELKSPDGIIISPDSFVSIRWFDRTIDKEVWTGTGAYALPAASIGHIIECKVTFSRDMIDRYAVPESITFLFDTSTEDFSQMRSMTLTERTKVTLKGKVAQVGTAGLTVTLVNRLTGYSKTVTLNADGSFIITDLPRVSGYELILDMADTVERIYEKETVRNFIFREVGSDGVIDLGTLTMQDVGSLKRIPVSGDTDSIGRVKLIRLSDGKEFSVSYDKWSGMLIISDKDYLLRRGDTVKLVSIYVSDSKQGIDEVTFNIPGKYANPAPLNIKATKLGAFAIRVNFTRVFLYDASGMMAAQTDGYAYLLPGTYTAVAIDSRIQPKAYATLAELKNYLGSVAYTEETITVAAGSTFEWITPAKEACHITCDSDNTYLMIFNNGRLVTTIDSGRTYYCFPGSYTIIAMYRGSYRMTYDNIGAFHEAGYDDDMYIEDSCTLDFGQGYTFDKTVKKVNIVDNVAYTITVGTDKIDSQGRMPLYIAFKQLGDAKTLNFRIIESDTDLAFLIAGGVYASITGRGNKLENISLAYGGNTRATLTFSTTAKSGTVCLYVKANGSTLNFRVNNKSIGTLELVQKEFSLSGPAKLTGNTSGILLLTAKYSGKKATAEVYVDGKLCGSPIDLVTYGLAQNRLPYSFKGYEDGSSTHTIYVVVYDENGDELWSSDLYTVTHTNTTVAEPEKLHMTVINDNVDREGTDGVNQSENAVFDIRDGNHKAYKFVVPYWNYTAEGKMAKSVTFAFSLEMSNPSGAKNVFLVLTCNKSDPYTRKIRLVYNAKTGMYEGILYYPGNTVTPAEIPYGITVEYEQVSHLTETQSLDQLMDNTFNRSNRNKEVLEAIEEEKKDFEKVDVEMLRFIMDNTENDLTEEEKELITAYYTEWNALCDSYMQVWSSLADAGKGMSPYGDITGDLSDVLAFLNGESGTLAYRELDESVTADTLLAQGFRAFENNGKTFYVGEGGMVADLTNRVLIYNSTTASVPTVFRIATFSSEPEFDAEIRWRESLDNIRSTIKYVDATIVNAIEVLDNAQKSLSDLIAEFQRFIGIETESKEAIQKLEKTEPVKQMRAAIHEGNSEAKIVLNGDIDSIIFVPVDTNAPIPRKPSVMTEQKNRFALAESLINEAKKFLYDYRDIALAFNLEAGAGKAFIEGKLKMLGTWIAKQYSKYASKAIPLVGTVINVTCIVYDIGTQVYDTYCLRQQLETIKDSAWRQVELLIKAADMHCLKLCTESAHSDMDSHNEYLEKLIKSAKETYRDIVDELCDIWNAHGNRLCIFGVSVVEQLTTAAISNIPGTVTGTIIADGIFGIVDGSFEWYDKVIAEWSTINIQDLQADLHAETIALINVKCWDVNEEEEEEEEDEKEITDKAVIPVIDPAGFVYEAVHSNRVKGLTAKVFYKGEDGNPVFWSEASIYGETNPQITNEFGEFAWMTPIGEWLVIIYDEEGNEIGSSRNDPAAVDGWLPVPPPQLSVYIGIISDKAPTVSKIGASTGKIQVTFSQYMDIAYLLAHPELITVTQDGVVIPVTFVFSDREESPTAGVFYGRVLEMRRADGKAFSGDNIKVKIGAGIKNYAGTAMGTDYESEALSARQTAAEIEHSYPNRLVVKKGMTETIALRVLDDNGLCMAGVTVTVRASVDGIFTFEVLTGVTDENGRVTFTLTGADAGDTVFTFTTDNGVSAEMNARVVTEPAEKPKKPTANLGDFIIVSAGTKLILSCETEGAIIYYTTDNTCPCTDGTGRKIYNGEITLTESGFYRIAAYTEDGGYSERLNIHVIVVAEAGDANGDGVIDTLDLMTLRAYLAGKIETISTAADINDDGTVDTLDLVILRKMLVGAE